MWDKKHFTSSIIMNRATLSVVYYFHISLLRSMIASIYVLISHSLLDREKNIFFHCEIPKKSYRTIHQTRTKNKELVI